ncbi:unnamed protein product [Haemonchus placei]|uniref:Transposase n=1 Tax=Haemonchus placei TaxID=6290 RepID=A0A0N4VWH2_HAEPC|nr:unnamed protein product [Haemonchus placei]
MKLTKCPEKKLTLPRWLDSGTDEFSVGIPERLEESAERAFLSIVEHRVNDRPSIVYLALAFTLFNEGLIPDWHGNESFQ